MSGTDAVSDTSLVSDRKIQLSDLSLRVVEEGDGEPVLLLHGFPDSADLWRNQIPALAQAGFRVVAPDLRGFGESDKPQDVEAYSAGRILADIAGIMDATGLEEAHVVGHDWGAGFAWAVAGMLPERVKSLAVLSVGHPRCYGAAGLEQREKAWYTLLFQFEIAEEMLRADDWQLFRDLVRNHPELERWIPALERPGALSAALNWYRANAHPSRWGAGASFPPVGVPTLGIWSSDDAYLIEAQMADSGRYVDAPWRYERITASHWMQLDRPDRVNELLLDFLPKP